MFFFFTFVTASQKSVYKMKLKDDSSSSGGGLKRSILPLTLPNLLRTRVKKNWNLRLIVPQSPYPGKKILDPYLISSYRGKKKKPSSSMSADPMPKKEIPESIRKPKPYPNNKLWSIPAKPISRLKNIPGSVHTSKPRSRSEISLIHTCRVHIHVRNYSVSGNC